MVSFPFDSKVTGYDAEGYPEYDRAVNSDILAHIIRQFVGTGIFPVENCFEVSENVGMLVSVAPGSATLRGITCYEEAQRSLTVQASDTYNARIDSVILRLDTAEDVRDIDLYVKQGIAAAVPQPPELNRSGSVYELGLANLYIPANTTTIDAERITDTRADADRCGYAKGMTEEFVQSVNSRFALLQEVINANRSHIGMVVQSVTLDTEEKVKAVYGGTSWVQIWDEFLIGAGRLYTVCSQGGERTHRLTEAELPSHSHGLSYTSSAYYDLKVLSEQSSKNVASGENIGVTTTTLGRTTNETGGGQAHNNMPPYYAVYIWVRVE